MCDGWSDTEEFHYPFEKLLVCLIAIIIWLFYSLYAVIMCNVYLTDCGGFHGAGTP